VHTQSLADCDAVVLFYGAGDEAWKRAMDNELRKLAGYRNGRPLLGSFTYLSAPATDDKRDLVEIGGRDLIDGLGGSVEAELSAFVQAVRSAEAARR